MSIGDFGFASNGDFVFRNTLDTPSGPTPSLWEWTAAGGLALLAQAGDPAPGTASAFASFDSLQRDAAGDIVVRSLLQSGRRAIFRRPPSGSITFLLQDGDPAPGPPGWEYQSPSPGPLNESGDFTFGATLLDASSNQVTARYLVTADDEIVEIHRSDDGLAIELAPGDVRVPDTLSFGRVGPGRELAAHAAFADGSEAVVWTRIGECQDGIDNDGDGLVDYPDDPGCRDAFAKTESPECQDGQNNDADGLVDFDGGQSVHGACSGGACPPGVSDPNGDGVADPDPECVGQPWRPLERQSHCGLGAELVLLGAALAVPWRRRRRRASADRPPRGA